MLAANHAIGKTIGGRYKIISHLGGGGYGQTYLAEDIHLPNSPRCVVKQLKPQATDSWNLQVASRLFNTEAQVLYQLGNHDQIPRLFAHFEENQEFYLVQEFIEGVDLSTELSTGQTLREAQVISLLKELLEVLEFVHQERVIHRDINPRNIIRRKLDNKLVLIDFGAVKQISTRVFNAQGEVSKTVAIGTAGYMPNEQISGTPHFCSDIYAVGIIAVQALTGLDPTRHQLPRDPQTGEIYWRNRAVVNPALAKIIDRTIASNVHDRYQAASEVLNDLKTVPSYSETVEITANTLPLEKPKANSGKVAAAINPLPRSQRGQPITPLKITIGLGAIAAILTLLKLFSPPSLESTSSPSEVEPANPTPEAVASPITLAPLPSPPPQPRLSRSRANRAIRFFQQGEQLRRAGQYESALKVYNDALAINPAYPEAHWGRCDAFSSLNQYDNAIASCDRAIQYKPDYARAWWSKGNILDSLERHEEALAHYDRALEIYPNFSEALSNRGAILTRVERYEEALTAYNRAVEINPDLPEAWYNRGIVLTHLQRLPEAIAAYDKAIQLKPDYQAAIENRQRVQEISR